MIGSFSNDPEEDEIILNEGNLRPEYSQTEDTAIDDDFQLPGIMRNNRGKLDGCIESSRKTPYGAAHKCKPGSLCSECVRRGLSISWLYKQYKILELIK